VKQPKTLSQELLLLLFLIAATAAASYGIVKLIHKPLQKATKSIDTAPVAWEKVLKERIAKYLANDSRTMDDPTVLAAIDSIKTRLLAHERDTTYSVDIMVVESETVNAVTFPGGLIVVFTPLIRLTDSPEELAAVIAHELGHVAHRDPLKQMAREAGVSAVLSMLNGGKAMPMVESMIKDFLDVQYTREQEKAADDYAFGLLSRSGISPGYFAVFMEKLAPDSSDTGTAGRATDYFSTHPNVKSRIADAKAAAKSFDAKSEKPFRIDWKVVKRNLPSIFDE
jgi:beta-barrel assembly-enhancing protease